MIDPPATPRPPTHFAWVRHAPSFPPGHVYGRTDVPASPIPDDLAKRVVAAIGPLDVLVCSPAARCRSTMAALREAGRWTAPVIRRAGLREQDFGDWEGLAAGDVPDIGTLSAVELAHQRPPGGESFQDVFDRVAAEIVSLDAAHGGRRIGIVAHAGSIRAALALALGGSAGSGLAFAVDPLSITRMTAFTAGQWRIDTVNAKAFKQM
ncbi:MAG: histidine phosphatase family protein [Inquilinaceae bacterium]